MAKSKLNLQDFSRIAIIQTAFLGDVALVLWLAQAIRQLHQSAHITLVTTPVSAPLAECAVAIDSAISFDKRRAEKGWHGISVLSQKLRGQKTDLILAPHRSFRTTLISTLAKPSFSVGFDRNSCSFLYSRRAKYYFHLPEVERNMQLLSPFVLSQKILKSPPKPEIKIPEKSHQAIEILLQNAGIISSKPLVVIAPGSVWATKRWTEEHFTETAHILKKQGCEVVLTGSGADEQLCRRISEQSGAISIAGQTTIPESLALFSRASVLLCNDSAPTHLANLVKCQVVTIFGPTAPMFGFAPRGENDKVLENLTLKCRPCSIHGGESCPLGTHECMRSVLPSVVVENILTEVLKNS